MKIQTFTVVAGSLACNARCPFCVAQMTPEAGVSLRLPETNWRNLDIGIDLALANNVTTALITSKGEPTLFPDQLAAFIQRLGPKFPFVELQTNGLLINTQWDNKWEERMRAAYQDGLTTVAISIAHFDPEKNRKVYIPHRAEYPDLPLLIERLHDVGLSVRLTLTMCSGIFDSVEDMSNMVDWAKERGVEQLTLRPVAMVDEEDASNIEVARWTRDHLLKTWQIEAMVNWAHSRGTKVMTLPHGAEVFDVRGQNLCLTDCLTIREESDDIRQLIFFPDGALRYDWRYEGARLL